ncbi:2OG-Fe dioxygenase family protein, partial [Salmonella enterica]
LLVNRQNIASGTTTIHTPDGKLLGDFTLTHPLDAALVYDHSVYHGVTPVSPLDADQPAFRDVLVVTFKAASPSE